MSGCSMHRHQIRMQEWGCFVVNLCVCNFSRFRPVYCEGLGNMDECSHVSSTVKLGRELCLLPAVYEALQS